MTTRTWAAKGPHVRVKEYHMMPDGAIGIQLTQGKIAIIDPEDFELVDEYIWHTDRRGYARSGKNIKIHRLIMGVREGFEIDHVNRDGLDNRRSNLRWATLSQNRANTGRAAGVCGYRGVRRDKKKFMAQIGINGKSTSLGNFATAEEAAKAYDTKAIELFGEFAQLNFGRKI